MIEGVKAARRVRDARRRRRRVLLGIFAVALLALAAFFGRRLLEPAAVEEAAPPAPQQAPVPDAAEAPAETAAPLAAEPVEPLPPLAESDAFVRERAASASARPELAGWLAGEGLVPRFVAAVDNVAHGESPRAHLRELAPAEPFQATPRSGRSFATERAWSRYALATAVFASLDAQVCATLHRLLLPLFEEAHAELGRREGSFDELLARAFRELLATPVPEGESELVPAIRSYRFADPSLEALSPAQKHLVRMGPRGAREVQAKLRELAPALGLEIDDPTASLPAR